jgi:G6PDH family F420-dependent oxidoreductase
MSDPASGPATIELGWWLSSEEQDPRDLVDLAVRAEQAGCALAMISDHLQPWTRHQGESPHAWPVLGAIARATQALRFGTGVTAMVHRHDPIGIAQAAATVAVMSGDRFFLGVGAGERLNEQPFGARWPAGAERRAQLREAVDVIRSLWSGELTHHRGDWWHVEGLRLMTRPATPPPIYVAAAGKRSAMLAGEIGDGVIGLSPDQRIIEVFRGTGGDGKPCIAQLHVSFAASVEAAVDNAWEWWPNAVVPPALLGELARPEHFEAASATSPRDAMRSAITCADGPEPIIAAIDRLVGAGYGTVVLHQVGPDQEGLLQVCERELLPHYAERSIATAPTR